MNGPLAPLINLLMQAFSRVQQPANFALNASPQQRMNAFNNNLRVIASDPARRISFGGDIASTSPWAIKPQAGSVTQLFKEKYPLGIPDTRGGNQLKIEEAVRRGDVIGAKNLAKQANQPMGFLNRMSQKFPGTQVRPGVFYPVPKLHSTTTAIPAITSDYQQASPYIFRNQNVDDAMKSNAILQKIMQGMSRGFQTGQPIHSIDTI